MHSEHQTQYWVICPVCYKPSLAGTEYCQHCWGASLHSSTAITTEEMQEILRKRQDYQNRRHIIKLATIILVSLLILASITLFILYTYSDTLSKPSLFLNSSSHIGEWAMFRHDLHHSGAAGSTDALPQGKVEWTSLTGGAIQSSPAVANGTVYVGSRDGKLYAIDAASGSKRWEYQTGSFVESSPAVAGGVVYFGSNDGNLYALNANTGERLWFFKTSYPIVSSPAVAGGIVYFGSDNYNLYALDALTGKKRWEFKTAGPVQSSPVIANGIVYFGSGNEFLYALQALNGRLRLHFKSLDSVYSSPAVSGENVYFGNSSGFLYAVQGNARNWPWEHSIRPIWIQLWAMGLAPTPPFQSGSIWGIKLGGAIQSSPVVVNNTAYVGVDNNLTAVDLQNSRVLWVFGNNGLIRSSPTVAGNTIYVGSDNGRLYAVDVTSGKKLWDVLTGDKIGSSPAFADGTIYVGSYDGKLYAIK